MVQLENMSQKTNNQEFTQRPITTAGIGHNVNLQTILYSQQNYKQRKRSRALSLRLWLTKTWVRSRKSHSNPNWGGGGGGVQPPSPSPARTPMVRSADPPSPPCVNGHQGSSVTVHLLKTVYKCRKCWLNLSNTNLINCK